MWIPLDSSSATRDLLQQIGDFHDGCLREVSLATGTYVGAEGGMACPGHLDTSAYLYFQSQNRNLPALELRCLGVSKFWLRPTDEGCDSIISSGTVEYRPAGCRLAVSFLGGPLTGPPNSALMITPSSSGDSDLEVVAQSMSWRPLPGAHGQEVRYRLRDD